MVGKGVVLSISILSMASSVGTADPVDFPFIDAFKKSDLKKWEIAEYDFDHPHFDTDWRKQNVVFDNGGDEEAAGLTLTVTPSKVQSQSKNRFIGGSIRRKIPTIYGRYESLIKPAKGSGFVTGFFTYTGPFYGTKHDEIDIEFLGKNTKQIHIAWFSDGVLTNKFIDLPFDAAKRPRLYAFEWLPDRINWYVEDELIYSAKKAETNLPITPSLLFANVWAADPSIRQWAGKTEPEQSSEAWFGQVKFTPMQTLFSAEKQAALTKIETTAIVDPASLE